MEPLENDTKISGPAGGSNNDQRINVNWIMEYLHPIYINPLVFHPLFKWISDCGKLNSGILNLWRSTKWYQIKRSRGQVF